MTFLSFRWTTAKGRPSYSISLYPSDECFQSCCIYIYFTSRKTVLLGAHPIISHHIQSYPIISHHIPFHIIYPKAFHGFPWLSMAFHGFPWLSMAFQPWHPPVISPPPHLVLRYLGICNEASLAMRLQVPQGAGHVQPRTIAVLRPWSHWTWGSKFNNVQHMVDLSSQNSAGGDFFRWFRQEKCWRNEVTRKDVISGI